MTHDLFDSSKVILKQCVQNLVETPGVYRFYSKERDLLYVGKARNLKKRVSNYLRKQDNERISMLVSQIAHVEITLTATENDALILESNLIKSLKPQYNVLLRDDKTYPYLVISKHDDYPRLYTYRGKPQKKAEYFGPYPNIFAMRESLNLLQKLFKIRSCRDAFFSNRTRPCLQYQMKRCTAPCVQFISAKDYQKDVHKVRLLLQGKSHQVMQKLTQQMETASQDQDYEKAAYLLDQISSLRQIQQQQAIVSPKGGNLDVLVWETQAGLHCIYLLPIRNGEILGAESYFPKAPIFLDASVILSQFIGQLYTETLKTVPEQILINIPIEDQTWVASALSKHHNKTVAIRDKPKKKELQWLSLAQQNATQTLEKELRTKQQQHNQRQAIQHALNLPYPPERLECFDISHSKGESTVASCVVFDEEGPSKSSYRRFNIKNITPGDDYAAMKQALKRRYEPSEKRLPLPDLLIIDGGKGQLTQAVSVLTELGLADQIEIMGIAKGSSRKPGQEVLFLTKQKLSTILEPDNPGLHLLQHIRDEAHRFAITGHRQQRAKRRQVSILETIKGIGPRKRKKLLTHFGGLQGLRKASLFELHQLPGITSSLANNIYVALKSILD